MLLGDEINYTTHLQSSGNARKRVLIFFIPGNPGLVEYYRHFLQIIRKRLNDRVSHTGTQYYISGGSLAGFDVNPGSRKTPVTARGLPLSLDDEVDDVYARLQATVARLRLQHDIRGDLPVVVVGHSIGAYMVLETVAKWKKLAKQGPTNMEITAGLCLFPTIFELFLSPTGRRVGVRTACHIMFILETDLRRCITAFDQDSRIRPHSAHDCQSSVLLRTLSRGHVACPTHHWYAASWRRRYSTVSPKQVRSLASVTYGQRRALTTHSRQVVRRLLGHIHHYQHSCQEVR